MSRAKGYQVEQAAAAFLVQQGYHVLAQNYTIRGAEVDIIAREGETLAFVEVKHRSTLRTGVPREAVTPAKQRRICMAALHYMQANGLQDAQVRFDVVESTPQGLTLLRNAFAYIE